MNIHTIYLKTNRKPVRINVRSIRKIPEGGGMTLRNGCPVAFQSGYQVGIQGFIFATPEEVSKFLHTQGRHGDWGIWRDDGKWYVDESRHIATKSEAVELGNAHDQLSIYGWAKETVIWLKKPER